VEGKSVSSSVNPCTHGQVEGSVPLEEGARICGLEPKRLLGRIWRNLVKYDDAGMVGRFNATARAIEDYFGEPSLRRIADEATGAT
jgi:hypothetical protein